MGTPGLVEGLAMAGDDIAALTINQGRQVSKESCEMLRKLMQP
jgi:hypothetical protein